MTFAKAVVQPRALCFHTRMCGFAADNAAKVLGSNIFFRKVNEFRLGAHISSSKIENLFFFIILSHCFMDCNSLLRLWQAPRAFAERFSSSICKTAGAMGSPVLNKKVRAHFEHGLFLHNG